MSRIALFDCAAFDAEMRIVVQQRTGEIEMLRQRVMQDIVDTRAVLIKVRELLQLYRKPALFALPCTAYQRLRQQKSSMAKHVFVKQAAQ